MHLHSITLYSWLTGFVLARTGPPTLFALTSMHCCCCCCCCIRLHGSDWTPLVMEQFGDVLCGFCGVSYGAKTGFFLVLVL